MSDASFLGILQLIGTLATVIIGAVVSIRLAKMHKQVNSRMDELLTARKAEGKAEGKAEEKTEQIDRDKLKS